MGPTKRKAQPGSKKGGAPSKKARPDTRLQDDGLFSSAKGAKGKRAAQTTADKKQRGPKSHIPVAGMDSGSDGDDSDGGMDVDEDIDLRAGASFLTKLDHKGISASRATVKEAHKKDRPPAVRREPLKYPLLDLPESSTSTKKAAKKRKAGSDDESDEEAGERLADLSEDDLFFGSGESDDDDLSVMSDFDAAKAKAEMSDFSDISDSDLDGEEDDSELNSAASDDAESEFGGIKTDAAGSGGEEASGSDEVDEDEDDFSDEEDFLGSDLLEFESSEGSDSESEDNDDLEEAYHRRQQEKKSPSPEEGGRKRKGKPERLPIIQDGKVVRPDSDDEEEASPTLSNQSEPSRPFLDALEARNSTLKAPKEYKSDPLGQRFGRPSLRAIMDLKDKRERVGLARVEIAELGREAGSIGEGEGSLGLLRRLLALTARRMALSAGGSEKKGTLIDNEIRVMAMLSLLAVLIDIIPGYRIRSLTEEEAGVKVSQMVLRQREWEQGLVAVHKQFLQYCEGEVTAESPIAPAALHCLCQVAKEKPDFNFSVNVMDVVVKRIGRKGWDDGHELCLATINHLLVNDTSGNGTISLHIVRLISRLVRARSFAVRPQVIAALLNLRLRDELGTGRVRASTDTVYREKEGSKGQPVWSKEKVKRKGKKGGKAKEAMAKLGSKKSRDAVKEARKIEKEMAAAEGEVTSRERESTLTETLKLLFALLFRIVKLERRNHLLPAALEGLARFAHLVNVDFFRDLLDVLKGIIKRGDDENAVEEVTEGAYVRNHCREQLLCIVTAFELLQGQGEALNIDLGDFVSALYRLITPLSLSTTIETSSALGREKTTRTSKATSKLAQTEADLLFRALAAIFIAPRQLPPPVRTLAFSKRLLTASLNWPSETQLRTLGFLRSLLIKEPRLEAMLESADRRVSGRWRGEVDEPERAEPESTNWWEASLLRLSPDEKVRADTSKLVNWVRDK